MNKKLKKMLSGYVYSMEGSDWKVETDYQNHKIYLNPPDDDDSFADFKEFGRTIVQAVADMKKDLKK